MAWTETQIKQTRGIYNRAMWSFQYMRAIRAIERKISVYGKRSVPERIMVDLGTLYDHAALKTKDGKEVKRLEGIAFTWYRKALRKKPNYYNAVWGIARIYWHHEDQRALPYALKAYRMHKKYSETNKEGFALNVANVYVSLKQYTKAELWYKKCLTTRPREDWLGIYLNMTHLYRDWEKPKLALRYAQKALAEFKKKPLAFRKTVGAQSWLLGIKRTIRTKNIKRV